MRPSFKRKPAGPTQPNSFVFQAMTADETLNTLRALDLDSDYQRAAKTLIYNKAARPVDLHEQFLILRVLSSDLRLSLPDQHYALIACSHKAMERLDSEATSDLLPRVLDVPRSAAKLSWDHHKIRKSGLHIAFSAYTVLLHMHLFLRSDEFFSVAEEAANDWVALGNIEPHPAFFQTCTNVARVLGLSLLNPSIRGEYSLVAERIAMIQSVFRTAIRSAYPQETVEDEFLAAVAILIAGQELVSGSDSCSEPQISLLRACLRRQGPEKLEVIVANYRIMAARLSMSQ